MNSAELISRWQHLADSAIPHLEAVRPGSWGGPSGYEGWTAKDLLAHLSSTQQALSRLVESAFSESPAGPSEPFDEDRWNASQVRRRREWDPQELIDELREGTVTLARTLQDRVSDPTDMRRRVPAGAGRGHPLGEVLDELLEHQRRHLSDLLESVR